MANDALGHVLRHIRQVLGEGAEEATDDLLLERFVLRHE
jgi:hypothetical protein